MVRKYYLNGDEISKIVDTMREANIIKQVTDSGTGVTTYTLIKEGD